MAKELWFDRLGEVLGASGSALHTPPVSSAAADAAAVDVQPFGPFDDGAGAWQFRTGLAFDMPAASPARPLLAMATGTMRFIAGTGGAPARVVLTRGDLPTAAVARAGGALPAWYPPVPLIVYENVDRDAAKAAAIAALGAAGELGRALGRLREKLGKPDLKATAEELATRWLADEIPQGIAVKGRERVGTCGAAATAGRASATVRLVERITPDPVRFWNPAFLIALWDAEGWLPSGNALLAKQADTAGPIVSTGKLFLVAKAGSGTAPFDSPAKAATTIPPALAAAAAGDTVLVLDSATYTEALDITKPVSLTSVSTKPPSDPAHGYPKLDGQDARRPVTIRNATGGVTHVSRFEVTGGRARHGTDHGVGGGILVDRMHAAVVSSCHVHGNQTAGGGIFSEGYGGGIGSYHASPAIVGCLVEGNHAQGRGSGIGAWGYGWPSIFDCRVRGNTPQGGGNTWTPTDPLITNERPDGGGIAITVGVNNSEDFNTLRTTTLAGLPQRWTAGDLRKARANHVRLVRSVIEGNTAGDDGGGLYVSIATNVRMVSTDIRQNLALRNGGGIRVTMRSELRIRGGTISGNASNSASDANANHAGGGISSRNTTLLELRGVTIEDNESRGFAGGGIYFISSDEGDILPTWPPTVTPPPFDWNNVLLDVMGFTGAELTIDGGTKVRQNRAQVLPGRTSGDPGKGGGLYALRFKGARRATRVTPTITGPPLTIDLAAAAVLEATNVSTFAGAARLYLEDQSGTTSVIQSDADLPASGGHRYP